MTEPDAIAVSVTTARSPHRPTGYRAVVGIVLALVSSVLWGIGDFAGGTASRAMPALTVVFVSQAAGLAAAVVAAAAAGSITDPIGYLPWAITAGLAGSLGLLAFYQGLATGTMGIVSPIAALGVVVPVAVGLASGQWPSLLVGLGLALALAGVVAASGPERAAGRSLTPMVLALVAALCFGVTLLSIARGAAHSPLMTMVGMRIASVALMGVVFAVSRRRFRGPGIGGLESPPARRRVAGRVWLLVGVAGIFDVTANLTFAVASTLSALTIVSILGSVYPAMTVLLARFVHGELLSRIQKAGVAVAVVGIALIAGWS